MVPYFSTVFVMLSLLCQVEMTNMMTNKTYQFRCSRWFAVDEEDGCILREIPAEGEDIKRPQPCK